MHKTILVLIDGLSAASAVHMGWLGAMTASGKARTGEMLCALPPLSRPLYHCILGGQEPVASGIVANDISRSPQQALSLFHYVREAGGVTAAAAYHWMSELYNTAPFDAVRHRLTDDACLPIQHGIFYWEDGYPDSHVLMDAEALRQRWAPDFLLVHTMGVDNAGHLHGGDSPAYRAAARTIDGLLAHVVPGWLAAGYGVWITSDHGMHSDGSHNDVCPCVREVPVWAVGPTQPLPTQQTQWLPTLRVCLGC